MALTRKAPRFPSQRIPIPCVREGKPNINSRCPMGALIRTSRDRKAFPSGKRLRHRCCLHLSCPFQGHRRQIRGDRQQPRGLQHGRYAFFSVCHQRIHRKGLCIRTLPSRKRVLMQQCSLYLSAVISSMPTLKKGEVWPALAFFRGMDCYWTLSFLTAIYQALT